MLKEDVEEGIAGGSICWEVRLEVVLEVRRGDEARGRGDGGTEFKSGAIFVLESWEVNKKKMKAQRWGGEIKRRENSSSLITLIWQDNVVPCVFALRYRTKQSRVGLSDIPFQVD